MSQIPSSVPVLRQTLKWGWIAAGILAAEIGREGRDLSRLDDAVLRILRGDLRHRVLGRAPLALAGHHLLELGDGRGRWLGGE